MACLRNFLKFQFEKIFFWNSKFLRKHRSAFSENEIWSSENGVWNSEIEFQNSNFFFRILKLKFQKISQTRHYIAKCENVQKNKKIAVGAKIHLTCYREKKRFQEHYTITPPFACCAWWCVVDRRHSCFFLLLLALVGLISDIYNEEIPDSNNPFSKEWRPR